jgi:hypothetical protein
MRVNSEVRDFYGESGKAYLVIYITAESETPTWHVKFKTANGYEATEAKAAAIDCGSGLSETAITHEHWRKLWSAS